MLNMKLSLKYIFFNYGMVYMVNYYMVNLYICSYKL